MTTTLPRPRAVGARAAALLTELQDDPDFDRLAASTALYASCWSTFTGYPIVCQFDLDTDTEPLFAEATKVLALKAAVYELTDGNEEAAELVVSAPVDEMVHAVLAQATLVGRMQARLGIAFVHMTDQERFGWEPDDFTQECYEAAGWGTPPSRYWIGADETARRLGILDTRYASIGVHDGGRRVDLDFSIEPEAVALPG